MATRPRRTPDPSGGNVLFTLGLVSVVALLIVGYVMTNGGLTGDTENPSGNSDTGMISILPTATPVPAAPTSALSHQANTILTAELTRLQSKFDTLLSEKKSLEQQISEIKQKHQNELADLKFRIQILMDENDKLHKKLNGNS